MSLTTRFVAALGPLLEMSRTQLKVWPALAVGCETVFTILRSALRITGVVSSSVAVTRKVVN